MQESNFDKVLGAAFIFDGDKFPIAICDEKGKVHYQNKAWSNVTDQLAHVEIPDPVLKVKEEQSLFLSQWPTLDISENWQIHKLENQDHSPKGFLFRGKNNIANHNDILEYHKMINASKDGLTLINRDYCYKLCNEAFTLNKELEYNDILGKSISEVWGEQTFQNYIKPNLDECFKGKTVNYQLWIQFSKNVRRYMDVTYWPYREHGEVTHVVVNSRDITDIKIVEMELKENLKKAEMAAAVKSQFLSNMSHEIRTPLNGIIGTLSLLERSNLSKENLEFLNIIETSSSSLLTLVNDILDHAKIEAGKMDLETIRFSPQKTIQEITELFNYLATSKGIDMTSTFDDELPSELMGDPGRLKQVLSNLISNALKFTEEGEVKVKVEVLKEDNHDLIPIRIKVKDTGKGIDAQTLKKLFNPFEQGDQSSHRKHGGTGLGLSISKSLVEMMNGEIGVSSTLGEGSEFWFIVRFEPAAESKASKSHLKDLSEAHILCYHRDLSFLKIMKNELLQLGCQVSETDCEQDLKLERAPDFILIHDTSVAESLSIKDFFHALYPEATCIYLSSKGFRGESQKAWNENYKAYLTGDVNMGTLENTFQILANHDQLDQIVTRYSTQNTIPDELKILICEDNTLNQRLLLKILNSLGYHRIRIEENGLNGVKATKEKKFDLILMDIRMPELDGIEATKLIRSDSLNMDTFIIAITGDMMQTNKQTCTEAGMNDYLEKPFTKQQFLRFIKQLHLKS